MSLSFSASSQNRQRLFGWAASLPALVILVVPFLALVGQTHWHQFKAAYGDWEAVRVSLVLSACALVVIVGVGTPLSVWLARARGWGGRAVETLVLVSLLTPSLATGILLVCAYGPYGPVGEWLSGLGVSLNNNAASFIVAQMYGGLAYFVVSARTAFENIPSALEEAAQDLGCTPWRVFWCVSLPIAAREIATGAMIAWVRIIGEFGIAAVFSYFPQGIPVKLFVNLQNDGLQSVYVLVWILLLSLPLPLILLSLFKRVRKA
ncbi:molybdate ABC transporter permease subunit [Paraburkholderia bannensis]|uniref:molybdate ABC transporter permease subunit n=1 Tax=Paraburkholderia bannensis TaxID=765414 RepID=UPI002ABD3BEF|nr:ABC transporter permease subunit [Paraburkholderia bannensis]